MPFIFTDCSPCPMATLPHKLLTNAPSLTKTTLHSSFSKTAPYVMSTFSYTDCSSCPPLSHRLFPCPLFYTVCSHGQPSHRLLPMYPSLMDYALWFHVLFHRLLPMHSLSQSAPNLSPSLTQSGFHASFLIHCSLCLTLSHTDCSYML